MNQKGDLRNMRRLPPSRGCLVCGQDNPLGLQIEFFTDGKAAYGDFAPSKTYQGYDGVLHGGLLSTLLDEVMVQAIAARGVTAVTGKIEVRFRRPALIGSPLSVKGWVEEERGSTFTAQGQIRDEEGRILAEAKGIFFRAR